MDGIPGEHDSDRIEYDDDDQHEALPTPITDLMDAEAAAARGAAADATPVDVPPPLPAAEPANAGGEPPPLPAAPALPLRPPEEGARREEGTAGAEATLPNGEKPLWRIVKEAADERTRLGPPYWPDQPVKGRRVDRERLNATTVRFKNLYGEHTPIIERMLQELASNYHEVLPPEAVDTKWLRTPEGEWVLRVKIMMNTGYSYKGGHVPGVEHSGQEKAIRGLPPFFEWLTEHVIGPAVEAGVFECVEEVNSIVMNFYQRGSFVVGHRDPPPVFGRRRTILTTTFWSPCGLEQGGFWTKRGGKVGVPQESAGVVLMLPGDGVAVYDYAALDTEHSIPTTMTGDGDRVAVILRGIDEDAPELTAEEVARRGVVARPVRWQERTQAKATARLCSPVLAGDLVLRDRAEWEDLAAKQVLWWSHFGPPKEAKGSDKDDERDEGGAGGRGGIGDGQMGPRPILKHRERHVEVRRPRI
eukprot:gene8503-8142_t